MVQEVEDNPHNQPQKKLLIVDDEPQIRRMLARLLASKFDEIFTAGSGEEAEPILQRQAVTHLLVDYDLGPGSPCGEYLITTWRQKHPAIERALLITGKRMSHVRFPPEVDLYLSKVEDPIYLFKALQVDEG
jgi:CheY-like chemotaxis protein